MAKETHRAAPRPGKGNSSGWGCRALARGTRGSSSDKKSSRSHVINLHVGIAGRKSQVLLRSLDFQLHKPRGFYAPPEGRAAAPGHRSGGIAVPLLPAQGGESRPGRAAGLPGGKQKRKDMCYRRRGGEKGKKRSVTWRLFSLSARALLGAVVPEEGAAGSSPGRAGAGNRAHVSPRELLSFITIHSLAFGYKTQATDRCGFNLAMVFFCLFSSTH